MCWKHRNAFLRKFCGSMHAIDFHVHMTSFKKFLTNNFQVCRLDNMRQFLAYWHRSQAYFYSTYAFHSVTQSVITWKHGELTHNDGKWMTAVNHIHYDIVQCMNNAWTTLQLLIRVTASDKQIVHHVSLEGMHHPMWRPTKWTFSKHQHMEVVDVPDSMLNVWMPQLSNLWLAMIGLSSAPTVHSSTKHSSNLVTSKGETQKN